jgi:hypothetical protein
MSLYRSILKRAWEISWKFKYLWFFGLFAALLGNGGEFEIISKSFNINDGGFNVFESLKNLASTGIFSRSGIANISHLAVNDPLNLLIIIILFLIITAIAGFVFWLTVMSQAAIVNNSAAIMADKSHNLKEGITMGMKKFWPVFGMNLIIKAIIYFVFILIGLPIIISFSQSSVLAASVAFVVSFLVFIPMAIALSFIVKYAICYTVIKSYNFIESLKAGWQLFIKNWLISIEMAFILFFINFFAGILLILLLMILAIPFLFIAMMLIKFGLFFNFWVLMVLAFVILLMVIFLIGSVLATFQISSWTGLFIELIGRGGVSKLVRMFDKKTT